MKVKDLSDECGVVFDKKVLDADAMAGQPDESRRVRIDSLEQIVI